MTDGLKLWVDDERPVPDESWILTTTSDAAIFNMLPDITWEEISLDHDLGGEDTGMKVLDWMVENNVWPKTLTIHTSNPPARDNMLRTANRYAPESVDINVIYW